MNQVLLIKMSSMGDLVHCFPALTDAAQQGYRFDWVVEESFVDLAARHPAIDRIYPIALRRWRSRPLVSMSEFWRFRQTLRERRYALAVDAQGLLKSALVSRFAQADLVAGLAKNSAREGLASRFYQRRYEISWQPHAIDRLRLLFAAALNYEVDLSEPAITELVAPDSNVPGSRAGIESHAVRRRDAALGSVVLLQGTSWRSKEYPAEGWRQLVIELIRRGTADIQLISSNAQEHCQARAIVDSIVASTPASTPASTAASIKAARVQTPEPEILSAVIDRVAQASLVIGVDSGLTHLAATLGIPTLGLYGATSASRTGARGPKAHNMVSEFPCAPCMQRHCTYRGAEQKIAGQVVQPACFARWSAAQLLDRMADVWPSRPE